ncbi:MAG: hypothetical protein M4579_004762 [Chaenotheca gracillima]|nr:MAG: hypothetical protein M4579_004762 [Chaenotheca gracillima]
MLNLAATLLLGALLAPLSSATPAPSVLPRPFDCAAGLPDPAVMEQIKEWHDESTSDVDKRTSTSNANSITVDTYFHVVSSTKNSGIVTAQQMSNQLAVMNGAYASSHVSFKLISTDYTVNDAWASQTGSLPMTTALRKGTYSSLNIYFLTDLGSGVLGTCALPSPNPGSSTSQYYIVDGCYVAAQSVPGGSIYGYNQGKTAVHETGHWLGLLHTFQGNSCSGDGDSIADTPQQSTSTNGCPANKDSCPNVAGLDPIHNYMDYSQDSCYTQFTPGQNTRIFQMWNSYRAGK